MSRRKKKRSNQKLPWWVGLVLLLAILAARFGGEALESLTAQTPQTQTSSVTASEVSSGKVLTVRFLDVGQGDSILLTCGDETMLIDGGPVEEGQFLVSRLSRLGITELDCVLNTHPDEDHCGGLAGVLAKYPAQTVYSSVSEHTTKVFENFCKYAQQQGRQVEVPATGTSWQLGNALVTVIGPVETYSDTNNGSLVLRVEYGQTSFLFTGDMEQRAEEDLLEAGVNVRADVLKVGHHGSSTASSEAFLEAVGASVAVISAGEGNDYGHPHKEVLELLEARGTQLYRTDTQGEIIVVSDGSTLQITTDQTSRMTDAGEDAPFIGNKNSLVVHSSTCSRLPGTDNRVYFNTVEEAEEYGYKRHTCIP